MVWEDKTARNRTVSIDLERYFAVRERLIQSRATHLDQLADKLKEKRVQNVISAVLSGEDPEVGIEDLICPDDQQYVADLGLIIAHPYYFLADDLDNDLLTRQHKLKPGVFKSGRMVIETSLGNYQV